MTFLNIGGVDYTQDELATLNKAGVLQIAEKHNPASSTANAMPLHGHGHGAATQYGPLANPGAAPDMISLIPRVRSFSRVLNMRPADNYNEYQDVFTGVTAGSGTNATGFCADPPIAGQFKTTRLTFSFGSYYEKTKLNVIPAIGMRQNRADQARKVANMADPESRFIPTLAQELTDTMSQLANEMITFGIDAERTHEQVLFTGNNATASASARRGFIQEFHGFDQYIKTGYTAGGLDSVVKTFNALVSGTDSGGRSIVQVIADAWYGLQDRDEGFGITTNRYLVMRKDTFRALADYYAWVYYTRAMTGSSSLPITQSGTEITNFRDSMIRQQYLLVEGEEVPVVFTSGIPRENTANGRYKADIYIVPVQSSIGDLTYLEYADMNNPYINEFTFAIANMGQIGNMNNGLYLVANRSTGLCWEYLFASQMRLVVKAPALCGRIDDVIYDFNADIRDAIPGESFYANGGGTYWNGTFTP